MNSLKLTAEMVRELEDRADEEAALVYRNGVLYVEHVPGLLALRNITSDGEGYIVATLHGLPALLNFDDCWETDGDGNPTRLSNEGVDALIALVDSHDIIQEAGIAVEEWEARQ